MADERQGIKIKNPTFQSFDKLIEYVEKEAERRADEILRKWRRLAEAKPSESSHPSSLKAVKEPTS